MSMTEIDASGESSLSSDAILTELPPEKLLDTSNHRLIRAGLQCMYSRETVQAYLGYENQHQNRTWVQRLLAERARELAASSTD